MQDTILYVKSTLTEIACGVCGVIDRPAVGPGNGPHAFRAQCAHCGHFIKWLSQYPPTEREARRLAAQRQAMATRPPSPAQLTFLADLGDHGPAPETMLAASQRIDGLLRRGEAAS